MNYESFSYSGVKSIDYRNARYQGLVSKDNNRQGFGIILDDDMNLYCSEWSKGQLNGKTLIFLRNGKYIYGNWNQGEPHGSISYKSKKVILYANYYKGKTNQTIVSFYEPTSNVMCFYSEEFQKKAGIQLISSQTLNNLQLYKQYMSQIISKRCGILSNIDQITVLDYMQKVADKYQDFLIFQQKDQIFYFGFQNGLGVKFTVNGTIDQHIHQISIGNHHQGQKLIQIGAKYHIQSQCTQQGNFQTRQLISYNIYCQRPQQKCHLIFQNTHRKGLYFRNQYFDFKGGIISTLQQFCSRKLIQKCQQIQIKIKQSIRSSQLSRNQSNLFIENGSNQRNLGLLKQKSMKNIYQNTQKSAKTIRMLQDKNKPKYSKRNTYTQQNAAVNQLIKNYNQLRSRKAQNYDRSHSKNIQASKTKSKLSKLNQESKDVSKSEASSIKKQIKYLKHKIANKQTKIKTSPIKNKENLVKSKDSANIIKYNKSSTKSQKRLSINQREQTRSLLKQYKNKQQKYKQEKQKQIRDYKERRLSLHNIKTNQKNKELGYKMDMIGLEAKQQNKLSQYQIQIKIRQQILEQEKYRELKTREISYFNYQKERSRIWIQSINSPVRQRQSQFRYDEITLSPKEIKLQFQEISPRKPVLELKTPTQNFESYLQDLQSKRQKLIREFRQMSAQVQSNLSPSLYKPVQLQKELDKARFNQLRYPIQTNSIYTEYQSPSKQFNEQQNFRRKQESNRPKLTNYIYKNNESFGSSYRADRAPLGNTISNFNLNEYEQSAVKEFYGTRKKKYEYLLQ